jgi:hypothetical protein
MHTSTSHHWSSCKHGGLAKQIAAKQEARASDGSVAPILRHMHSAPAIRRSPLNSLDQSSPTPAREVSFKYRVSAALQDGAATQSASIEATNSLRAVNLGALTVKMFDRLRANQRWSDLIPQPRNAASVHLSPHQSARDKSCVLASEEDSKLGSASPSFLAYIETGNTR